VNRGRRDVAGAGGDRRDHGRPAGRSGSAPRGGRPIDDPARLTAYRALLAVHRDDAYANLILPSLLRDADVVGRDAAFATELTYGTLRNRGALDAIIAKAAARDVMRIDPPARDALRLGAYQLLHTRVPSHAAVASTVDLVRSVAPGAAGFANAVMRRISEHDLDSWLAIVAPSEVDDPVGHLAMVHNHPEWIVRAFREALGGDMSETARALAADNERPEVHLCARPGRVSMTELADETGGTPGAFSPYAVYLSGGSPGDLPDIQTGRAHVQDEGSQLVASALASFPIEGRDQRWLDLCAGPGGKARLLAALAAGRGARLLASDVHPHRARHVRDALSRAGGSGHGVIAADGRRVPWSPGTFDRVLADVPCSGLGSLRRRPEARWRKTPADVTALAALQRQLLGAAIDAARPGGVVAYVTCSPHLAETQDVVTDVVRARSDVTILDAPAVLPEVPAVRALDPRFAQFWPHRHGTDAIFLSLLARRSPPGAL
jgi:16S rRNA (cytosine967-C5)-methyltransferase